MSAEISAGLRRKAEQAGADFAAAFQARKVAADRAAEVARELHAAGMSEVELARLLGVDRARTLRRWLGK